MNPTIQSSDFAEPAFYLSTLTAVRELSENAMLRPAPKKLRCIPVQTRVLGPANAFKARIDEKLGIALLLAQMSREFNSSLPA